MEALVHATSKKDKCVGIVNTAIPILKQLYKSSTNDNVRVRALVVRNYINYCSIFLDTHKSMCYLHVHFQTVILLLLVT